MPTPSLAGVKEWHELHLVIMLDEVPSSAYKGGDFPKKTGSLHRRTEFGRSSGLLAAYP